MNAMLDNNFVNLFCALHIVQSHAKSFCSHGHSDARIGLHC